jgi:hypothetical protein
VISALIQNGADVNEADWTRLLMSAAASNPNPEVISALIQHGADVNAKDKDGKTALMNAARSNPNPKVITALIQNGAGANEEDVREAHRLAHENNKNPDVVVLLAQLISGGGWSGTAEPIDSGTGTESDPYIIDTAEKLAFLAKEVNDGRSYRGKWFKLTRDINLNNLKWTPIGVYGTTEFSDYEHPFSGHFDGGGHTIEGLYVERAEYAGLFGIIEGGVTESQKLEIALSGGFRGTALGGGVTNLQLKGVNVRGHYSGALAAEIGYGAEISRCSADGKVEGYSSSAGGGATGGLIGLSTGSTSSITACSFTGNVYSQGDAGGLIGLQGGGVISDCVVSADVGGLMDVGGFVGNARIGGKISRCESNGSVNKYASQLASGVGGFAGALYQSVLEECVAKSDVIVDIDSAKDELRGAGGLVGLIPVNGYGTVIRECSAFGSVSAKAKDNVGGLIGTTYDFESISESKASGAVVGRVNVGGLIGYAASGIKIADCTATGDVAGKSNVNALIGKNEVENITNSKGTGKVTVTNN